MCMLLLSQARGNSVVGEKSVRSMTTSKKSATLSNVCAKVSECDGLLWNWAYLEDVIG